MAATDAPQPNWVRPQLYLASARTEVSREVLDQHGITHILQAGVELQPSHAGHYTYLQLPVYDMPEQDIVASFPRAFAFIEQAMDAGGGVLVHCQAGISRSATLVIAWIMRSEHLSADAATAVVSAARSVVWPNPGFKCQLREYEALGCDAARWQGWSMAKFLSRQYGDESVDFMATMLGGAPQDRLSAPAPPQQQARKHKHQPKALAAGASADVAAPTDARSLAASGLVSASPLSAASALSASEGCTAAAAAAGPGAGARCSSGGRGSTRLVEASGTSGRQRRLSHESATLYGLAAAASLPSCSRAAGGSGRAKRHSIGHHAAVVAAAAAAAGLQCAYGCSAPGAGWGGPE